MFDLGWVGGLFARGKAKAETAAEVERNPLHGWTVEKLMQGQVGRLWFLPAGRTVIDYEGVPAFYIIYRTCMNCSARGWSAEPRGHERRARIECPSCATTYWKAD